MRRLLDHRARRREVAEILVEIGEGKLASHFAEIIARPSFPRHLIEEIGELEIPFD